MGVTEQIIGESWLNAKPFQYAGSIGPLEISPALEQELQRLGEVLRIGCGLRGLFGVDFILQDDRPWLVEVNPRYTASIEVLEYATGLQALAHHRAAFDERGCVSAPCFESRHTTGHLRNSARVGKAILFAPKLLVFPDRGPWIVRTDPRNCPDFADIPAPGEVIEEGWPILTIFAQGDTPDECRQKMHEMTSTVLSSLANPGAPGLANQVTSSPE